MSNILLNTMFCFDVPPYMTFMLLFTFIYAVNWSVIKRGMPSLLHLLSNHPCPHGCSLFSVLHLCLISLFYSYWSEIIDRCFQGCALTCHQLYQQATSHTESIRDCCTCVCDFMSKKGVRVVNGQRPSWHTPTQIYVYTYTQYDVLCRVWWQWFQAWWVGPGNVTSG